MKIITIDTGVNIKRLRKLEKQNLIKIEKVNLENKIKGVETEHSTIGILDCAKLPFRLGPYEIYDKIVDIIGRENFKDAMILESHINSSNDYFITNNPKDFIINGKREQLEGEFMGLRILTLEELEKIFKRARN